MNEEEIRKQGFDIKETKELVTLEGQVPNEDYYLYILKDQDFTPVLKGDMTKLRGYF